MYLREVSISIHVGNNSRNPECLNTTLCILHKLEALSPKPSLQLFERGRKESRTVREDWPMAASADSTPHKSVLILISWCDCSLFSTIGIVGDKKGMCSTNKRMIQEHFQGKGMYSDMRDGLGMFHRVFTVHG